jgi:hypothetical protein
MGNLKNIVVPLPFSLKYIHHAKSLEKNSVAMFFF